MSEHVHSRAGYGVMREIYLTSEAAVSEDDGKSRRRAPRPPEPPCFGITQAAVLKPQFRVRQEMNPSICVSNWRGSPATEPKQSMCENRLRTHAKRFKTSLTAASWINGVAVRPGVETAASISPTSPGRLYSTSEQCKKTSGRPTATLHLLHSSHPFKKDASPFLRHQPAPLSS